MEKTIQSARTVRFGNFEVDLDAGELRKSGLRLKFSGQPFEVLAILLEQPGTIVTREQLQKRLWPDSFVDFGSQPEQRDQSHSRSAGRLA